MSSLPENEPRMLKFREKGQRGCLDILALQKQIRRVNAGELDFGARLLAFLALMPCRSDETQESLIGRMRKWDLFFFFFNKRITFDRTQWAHHKSFFFPLMEHFASKTVP